jgi:uncharacterized membrane protein (UPF0127 family)
VVTTSTQPSTTTTRPPPFVDQGELEGWEVATVTLGDLRWVVALASTPQERSQGLMGVTDLGDLGGMLFEFEAETLTGFWMKDTLIPLDIAFFDSDRRLVEVLTMAPCQADPCPSYVPAAPYRWALEAPQGALSVLAPGTVLEVERP